MSNIPTNISGVNPENMREMIQREFNFASKYCARVGAIHQNAKDEVKALKTKLAELTQREKDAVKS